MDVQAPAGTTQGTLELVATNLRGSIVVDNVVFVPGSAPGARTRGTGATPPASPTRSARFSSTTRRPTPVAG